MLARLTPASDSVQIPMMKAALALIAALLLTLVPLAGDGRAQQPAAVSGCTIVWVTAPNPPGKVRSRWPPLDFSASKVLDLKFWVVLPSRRTTPGRRVEVKLFTPKGHLYQTLAAPVDAGRPRLFQTVTMRLPVAGTTIVNNSLYGRWTAAAYLEGGASPCTKTRKFQIRP